MAKCSVCNKGAHFGIKVSHSHRRAVSYTHLTLPTNSLV